MRFWSSGIFMCIVLYGRFQNRGTPKMDGYKLENPFKMDDLGVTPIFWKHLYSDFSLSIFSLLPSVKHLEQLMVVFVNVPGTVGSEGKLIVGLGWHADQLRLVVEIPLFTRFQHHPRWLFGISEPSTVGFGMCGFTLTACFFQNNLVTGTGWMGTQNSHACQAIMVCLLATKSPRRPPSRICGP